MAVVRMKKLSAVVMQDQADALISRLMRLRCVEVDATDLLSDQNGAAMLARARNEQLPENERRAAEIDEALALLHRRSQRPMRKRRRTPVLRIDAFPLSEEYKQAEALFDRVHALLQREGEIAEEIAARQSEIASYHPFLSYDLPLGFSGTRSCRILLGALPATVSSEALHAQTEESAALLYETAREAGSCFLVCLCHEDDEDEMWQHLTHLGCQRITFPGLDLTAEDATAAAQKTIDRLEKERDALYDESVALSEKYALLELLSDYTHTLLNLQRTELQFGNTEKTAILSAWVPCPAEKAVTKTLQDADCAYEFSDPEPEDDVPVLLQNPAIFRPFEDVLGVYSLPAYGTYDPTRIMSIFYFIIFGLMLADVGYGVMLSGICLLAMAVLRPKGGTLHLLQLFAICGISCILCGVLFGGYFGNAPAAIMKNAFHVTAINGIPIDDWTPALLFDPMRPVVLFGIETNGMLLFMGLSLAVGVLHLCAGMIIHMAVLFGQGKWFEAIFDVGSWLIVFAGIAVLLLAGTLPGAIVLGIGLLMIVATNGRHARNPLMKFLGGLLGLYNLVSYVSDVLSYARILALGLATTVIAQVINMTAGMATSPIGILLFPIFFLAGHALNLVINLLGAYVHTSRLQYIEFFNKFFVDGGRGFSPVEVCSKYTVPAQENLT